MNLQKYKINDLLELKKNHPCGCSTFKVLRVGSIMRIVCTGCSRDMEIDRVKLEKATKKIIVSEENSTDERNA
jgi:hypothetical protein